MTHIIRTPTMGVAGKYRLRVRRPDGRVRHDSGWFSNIITDAGLNSWGSTKQGRWVHVGSGTDAPAAGNTAMQSFVASTDNTITRTTGASATAPYFGWGNETYRFAQGAAEGNLTEVGISSVSGSTGPVFSRALITDAGGSPTTITVLADEVLDVTYQIQTVPPTTDVVSTIVDSGPAGTSHTVTVRASRVTSGSDSVGWGADWDISPPTPGGNTGIFMTAYDGVMGGITEGPSGNSSGNNNNGTDDPYVNGSLQNTATIIFSIDQGNFATGIQSVEFSGGLTGGHWQAEFDPPIMKTDTDQLDIGAVISWTRTTAL